MADCPVHGVPHRSCDEARAGQVEAVVEAIEADDTPEPPKFARRTSEAAEVEADA
jgi:hypothetical protein